MTQGITTTTFGYTGDGDRLWQEVADARTTFALDLNTALPQVLAQQSPDQSTRYLPGIGQQVGAVWQYLHTDALGSIRHITGEDGSVSGSWRYSPFGQIESTSGDGSLFGYTGEPQDPASGLTYLRARYYHPALGRFLTPDAIVPDVLNGQAWNAYAYVYNDPINLVDPSGYAPWDGPVDRIREIAGNAWRSVKDGFGRANQWWNEEPDECECENRDLLPGWGSLSLSGFSASLLGIVTRPTDVRASIIREERTKGWFSKTPWEEVKPPPYSGTYEEMEQIMPPGKTRVVAQEGRRFIGPWKETRWTLKQTGVKVVRGIRGIGPALGGSGLIDGALQWVNDWSRCLTRAERARNILVAGLFGVLAGVAGAAAFTIAAAIATPLLGSLGGKIVATTAGIGIGLLAGNYGYIPSWRQSMLIK